MKTKAIQTIFVLFLVLFTTSCGKKAVANRELVGDPVFSKIRIGLGWDAPMLIGEQFDLDLSAILIKPDGKTRSNDDSGFCFYNKKALLDGATRHYGDSDKGGAMGDDEAISVDTSKIPADLDRVVFSVTFTEFEIDYSKFGKVEKPYVRIVNHDTGIELARYSLSDIAPNESGLVFGELYRDGEVWKFRVLMKGLKGGLMTFAKLHGIEATYGEQ